MLFESVRDANGSITDFRWVEANALACGLVGRAREDLVGHLLLVEMPGNESSGLFDAYREVVLSGKPYERVLRYDFEDFDHWFELRAAQVGDGFVVLFEDVTARQRLQEERDATLQRLEQSFADAPFPVILTRASDLTIVSANRSAELAFARSLPPKRFIVEVLRGIDEHDQILSALKQTAQGGAAKSFDELCLQTSVGSSAYFKLVVAPISGHDLIQLVATDVTAQVVARQEAQRANRQKTNVLAVLGHELRNPLGTLALAIEALGNGPASDETNLRLSKTMLRQVQLSNRLLGDILDASRLDRDRLALKVEPVKFDALARQATLEAAARRSESAVGLIQNWPAEDVWVNGDPLRLTQIVTNLVSNAFKYTPSGSVSVRLSARSGSATLQLKDTGLGIPKEDLPRIFEAFHQVSEHRARSQGGLGLGLSIVHDLVRLHGGAVDVQSDGEGHGSTFTVRIPTCAQPPTQTRESAS